MAEVPLQHWAREGTFQDSVSDPVGCFGQAFSCLNAEAKDPVLLMEYSCPQLKGPDVTENRVVANQQSKGGCFAPQILHARTSMQPKWFNVT